MSLGQKIELHVMHNKT